MRFKRGIAALSAIALALVSLSAAADNVYQSPDAYLQEAFSGPPPAPKVLWLRGELRTQVDNILNHPYRGMRIRYWQDATRTVWILDEIGKDKPITTGITVADGKIADVTVLVFRESRGWEVRHDFFTRQFAEAMPGKHAGLDRHIDSITGAT
ncbi:MAG: FMN-binding protein, partial [Gammaproteobacteria bacterium]|nr:FMN-binding protein [Gammaproteobacteria bacterium]